MNFEAVCFEIERNIGVIEIIIHKILLDHESLIAQTDDKFVKTMSFENLHDVPEDRFFTDLDHRLRSQIAFFRNAGAQSSRQNNNFHGKTPFRNRRLRTGIRCVSSYKSNTVADTPIACNEF